MKFSVERTAESEIRKGNQNYSKIKRKEIKLISREKGVIRNNSNTSNTNVYCISYTKGEMRKQKEIRYEERKMLSFWSGMQLKMKNEENGDEKKKKDNLEGKFGENRAK